VVLGVRLGGFAGVVHGEVMMTVGHVRVMPGLVVITGLVVLGGFAMMPRGVLVMGGGVGVMICDRMSHRCTPLDESL
jgi:hypothetical protein